MWIMHLVHLRQDTDQERSFSRGNCRKCVIKCEECIGAELNPADKRFSSTIISTHWFEKWSLALTSGRAGVWDEVQLTNLNLQTKVNEKKYTLCTDTHACSMLPQTWARHINDNKNYRVEKKSRRTGWSRLHTAYLWKRLPLSFVRKNWSPNSTLVASLFVCFHGCCLSASSFVRCVATFYHREINKTEWKLLAFCTKYCELLKPNEKTRQAIVFYPAICHND